MVEILKYNDDNLRDDEIDEVVTKVRAFVISSKLNLMIGKDKDGFHLIEANVGPKEKLEEPLFKSLYDLTGISLDGRDKYEPFFEVRYYSKNYFDQGYNRLSDTIYYLIYTDKMPNIKKLKLTERQLREKMRMEFIYRDNFKDELLEYIDSEKNIINQIKAKEILIAFDKLKEVYGF